jgi:hypothetical protein
LQEGPSILIRRHRWWSEDANVDAEGREGRRCAMIDDVDVRCGWFMSDAQKGMETRWGSMALFLKAADRDDGGRFGVGVRVGVGALG